jgi:hypothetical protein
VSVTIAADSGERKQTLTDGGSQAKHAAALTVHAVTWLRAEGANAPKESVLASSAGTIVAARSVVGDDDGRGDGSVRLALSA